MDTRDLGIPYGYEDLGIPYGYEDLGIPYGYEDLGIPRGYEDLGILDRKTARYWGRGRIGFRALTPIGPWALC